MGVPTFHGTKKVIERDDKGKKKASQSKEKWKSGKKQ
jgi:hypothetical protein